MLCRDKEVVKLRLLYSIMPCSTGCMYTLTGYLYGSICVVLGRKKSHHGLNEEMFCWFHSFHSIPGFTIALYLQTEQTFVRISGESGDWWLVSPTMYDPCLCLPHTAIALSSSLPLSGSTSGLNPLHNQSHEDIAIILYSFYACCCTNLCHFTLIIVCAYVI